MRRQHRGGRTAGDDGALHGCRRRSGAQGACPVGHGARSRRGGRHGRRRGHAPARARRARRHRQCGGTTRTSAAGRTCRSSAARRCRFASPSRGMGRRIVRMPFKRKRARHRAPLPDGPAVDDVRRQQPAHAGAPDIKVRPPFRVVWSRGLGSLVEFPAVVADGVAVRRQLQGPHLRAGMRNGKRALAAPAEPREDGVLARDRRRRPGRARDGRDRPRARPAQRQAALALPRRLADRVVADRLRRARLLRRLERPRLRARPEAAEAALELPHRLQDHLERRDRRADALHRRLRRPPACARDAHGQAALRPLGQRPRLRDAGGRGGPRLRALLDRQQPDRLLDVGPLPLARRHGRLRLLLARGLGGTRLLRLLQRAALLRLGAERARALERRARAGRSRAPPSSSPASPTPARPGAASPASTRRAAASCSASRTASTCPSPATAAGCSCTATRACGRSSRSNERSGSRRWPR